MQQRKSALGRPSGTDGSDFSYRMVVDSRKLHSQFNFPKIFFFPILCLVLEKVMERKLVSLRFENSFELLVSHVFSLRPNREHWVLHPNAFFPWILGYRKVAKGKSRLYALIFTQVHTFLSLSNIYIQLPFLIMYFSCSMFCVYFYCPEFLNVDRKANFIFNNWIFYGSYFSACENLYLSFV